MKTGITTWPQTDTGPDQRDLLRLPRDRGRHVGQPVDPVQRGRRSRRQAPDTTPPGQALDPDRDPGNASATVNLPIPNSELDLASYTLQRKLTSAADATLRER